MGTSKLTVQRARRTLGFALASMSALATPSCAHFLRIGAVKNAEERTCSLDSLPGAGFISGIRAPENLLLIPDSGALYVTSLDGFIYLVDGPSRAIVSRSKVGAYVLGIDRSPDGALYAAVFTGPDEKDWRERGGAVHRIDAELAGSHPVTRDYPSINGIAFDAEGRLYISSSNFDFLFPKGTLYRLSPGADGSFGKEESVIHRAGLANGVFHDKAGRRVIISDTLETVVAVDTGPNGAQGNGEARQASLIYRKAALKEAFDDLCVDTLGRVWMTDPIRKELKVFDPASGVLVRIAISGFGQPSSCRIRVERSEEILYVSELKAPFPEKGVPYNGRGILRVPLASLLRDWGDEP